MTIILITYTVLTMYVCICNRLKEDLIRSLAEQGMGFDEIQAVTGCSNTCGSCKAYAEDLVLSVQLRAHQAIPLRVMASTA
ncbi:MAG: (2Fe-2S)-binding protein [Wenzhouxiangella sp.]